MQKMSKNIPTLRLAAALDFFLKSKLHHGFELPGRIDYDKANYLQYISYQQDKKAGKCPYDARLCHVDKGEDLALWNIDWQKPDLTKGFPQGSTISQETPTKVPPVIKFRKIPTYEDCVY